MRTRPSLRPRPLARAGLLAAGCLLATAAAGAEPVRVMALGDSLTKGVGSTHGAGYRLTFVHRMQAAGVDVDMVGSFHHGPKDIDRDHEGHQGQGVAKLDEISFDEIRNERPDVVILMIGTNDAKESQLVPDAFRIRYSVLLDRALAVSKARMIVATIPPHRFGTGAKVREAINRIIRDEVGKRVAQGKQIRLVDVYALLDNRKDFVDPLHMNDAGYERVGNAIADAFLEMLGKPASTASAATP